MALLAVAFYVVYITLDDVDRPQTPFPVFKPSSLQHPPPPPLLSLVFADVI